MEQDSILIEKIYDSPNYDCLAQIRADISDFICSCAAPLDLGEKLQLSATEIVSNLLQHPKSPPTFIQLRMRFENAVLTLEILDNASPFTDFKKHLEHWRKSNIVDFPRESGNGLGFVIRHHETVDYQATSLPETPTNIFTITEELPRPLPKPLVFVVDDDPFYHAFLEGALAGKYRVHAFDGAQAALDAFEQEKPDIIVSDLDMPEMDGLDLRRALSLLPDGDTTPFIFLSGHKETRDDPCLNRLGIDDFICKPVSEERLISVLDRLLHRSQQLRTQIEGKVGESITDLMRPALPENLGRWRAQVRSLAAETGGGDFVMKNIEHKTAMIVLTDVMGHGIEAKFFAYAYAGYLRSLFKSRGGVDPVGFLSCLSQEVAEDKLLESTLITCLAVTLQDNGHCTIASAGHPQPIALMNGTSQTIEVSGPLPGLAGDVSYGSVPLNLKTKDRIVLFTDGFLSAFGESRATPEKSYQALHDLISQSATFHLEKATNHLWDAFLQNQGRLRFKDDASLIILEKGD